MIDTDIFYTYVDNEMMFNNRLGIMMYRTVREDRGPQHYNLVDKILETGGYYVFQQYHLPVSLSLFKYRY